METALLWKDINVLKEVDYDKIRASAHVDSVRNALRGTKDDLGREATEEAIEHDSLLLATMAELHRAGRARGVPKEYRLLTADYSLRPAIAELQQAGSVPTIELPLEVDDWAREVVTLALGDVDGKTYEEYVAGVLKSQLGVVPEVQGWGDLLLIAKLEEAGLPIRTILEKSGAERDRIVESLVANRRLRELLRARESQPIPAPEVDQALLETLQKTVSDAVAFKEDLLDEIDRTNKRLADVTEERRQREESIALLQSEHQSLKLRFEEDKRKTNAEVDRLAAQVAQMRHRMILVGSSAVILIAAVAVAFLLR
jgi:hypothetical protein